MIRKRIVLLGGVLVVAVLLGLASILLLVWPLASGTTIIARSGLSAEGINGCRQAAAYSRAHRGLSMVVMKDGEIVFENYPWGCSPDAAHNLFSGTKSFSCAVALAAIHDGLLALDEPVSKTIEEWRTDNLKSCITIRQLLTLTSGIDAGRIGAIPTYAQSLRAALLHEPATAFQYGPVPFQVFGELMRRKLAESGENAVTYLDRRVLRPIGLNVASWRTGSDGYPRMPAGAFLTAREWAKYGQLILNGGQWKDHQILDSALVSECLQGTAVNPGYGMTFWLPLNAGTNSESGSTARSAEALKATGVPGPVIKAAGVGGQRLYIIPALKLVVVRQAVRVPLWGRGFKDDEFLAPIVQSFALNDRRGKENSG